jgi:hypothetical protein
VAWSVWLDLSVVTTILAPTASRLLLVPMSFNKTQFFFCPTWFIRSVGVWPELLMAIEIPSLSTSEGPRPTLGTTMSNAKIQVSKTFRIGFEQLVGLRVGKAFSDQFDIVEYVSVNDQQVSISIIVEIEKTCPKT